MKKLVILSGAGMSAESGIPTFRDMGGLWEKYDITEVASPQAWRNNPELVLRFYNERRKKLLESHPNQGHKIIAQLEDSFDVQIVTQNVDDLHERAGSSNILHLHGELRKVRSTKKPHLVHQLDGWELKIGDLCQEGSQLRPHIVWFGESVPLLPIAEKIVSNADIFVIVGTSLNVYPAAGLINNVQPDVPIFIIDPGQPNIFISDKITIIKKGASEGLKELKDIIKSA